MKKGLARCCLEPHPTRGFDHKGRWCSTHRYSLCFAPYELYHPKSAEQLAALRTTRQQKKAEREDKQWADENPLLAWAGDAIRPPGARRKLRALPHPDVRDDEGAIRPPENLAVLGILWRMNQEKV